MRNLLLLVTNSSVDPVTVALIGLAITILGIVWYGAVKITKLEVKVDTIWSMFLKRGVVEGVTNSLLSVNSPIRLINNSGKLLESMAGELREFHEKNCKGKSEADTALAIEKEFGSRLVKEICIPNKISFGVCILIAVAIAKNVETLTEILDHNVTAKPSEK